MKIKEGQFSQPPNRLEGKQYFFLRANKAYRQVRYTDILYCESLPSGYCRVVTRQETYVYNNTLKVLQDYLPSDRFCRIHKAFIVGIDHISWFHEKTLVLLDPPMDGSYRKGFAHRTQFTIGVRYIQSMREHLLAASSRRGGYSIRAGRQLESEILLEEMEWPEEEESAVRENVVTTAAADRDNKRKKIRTGLRTLGSQALKSVGFTAESV